ncbi:hypothetical protein GF420_15725 [candidate division GN15 bacterium]|nr:hypothetical protein [candidate division GN15 bacterium]
MEVTPEEKELIEKLQAHALENYQKGWDIFYETFSDWEILKDIHEANKFREREGEEPLETYEEIRDHFAETMGLLNERRDEVRSFIF